MRWEKLGRILGPDDLREFGVTAALMPIARVLDAARGLVRVYFSPRDLEGRSQVRYIEFEVSNPRETLQVSENRLFEPGKLGAFDDAGVTLGSVVEDGDRRLLFYTGWNLTVSVPFNNSIGVAELRDDDSMHRLGDGPIMTRTLKEPYSCASPFVLKEEGVFKMWYASMDSWKDTPLGPLHFYNIKFANSPDGISWNRFEKVAIDYEKEDEYAFGRPFVLRENGIYKMWYSYRGDSYRIGYAESTNGESWIRKDSLAGISVSEEGWDSEMVEYPFLFDCDEGRFMLYNGNGYGKSGLGLAKLVMR
jgi:hypothetical protein